MSPIVLILVPLARLAQGDRGTVVFISGNIGLMGIRIREIDHIVLRVIDLDRMLDFYCGVLGCEVERRVDEIGLIQLRAGRSLVDLVPVESELGRQGGAAPGPEGRNLDHLCFRIDPFDEDIIVEHLQEHSVDPGTVTSRYGAEGRGPSMYVEDPEGNIVELKGPPE